MKYNWSAGKTYKFLLKGQPDNKGNTDYTAWFFAPEIRMETCRKLEKTTNQYLPEGLL